MFTDETDIFLGGKEVRMKYYGRSHTNGDAVVYFPALKILASGDMGANNGPNVDFANGGSIKEWGKTLDEVLKLDFDTVIPGHGSLATKADLVAFRGKVAAMVTRLTGLIKGGKNKAEVAKVLEDDYGWRSTGCPPSPPTGGCLQYQQLDALMTELGR